jgi:hypothetical protein
VTKDMMPLRARALMAGAFRDLLRPPFSVLLAVTLFVTFVTTSLRSPFDELTTLWWILLAVVNVYLQIAVVLAAATTDPSRSADQWLRAAIAARCFWRSVLVELLTFALIVAGGLVLIVGAFVVGAYLSLAQSAVVLERASVAGALRRSVDLGADVRVILGVLFGSLVLVPSILLQVGSMFVGDEVGPVWVGANLAGVVVLTAGVMALARAFVVLGGTVVPPARRA